MSGKQKAAKLNSKRQNATINSAHRAFQQEDAQELPSFRIAQV